MHRLVTDGMSNAPLDFGCAIHDTLASEFRHPSAVENFWSETICVVSKE
jgi:hypothetical protein